MTVTVPTVIGHGGYFTPDSMVHPQVHRKEEYDDQRNSLSIVEGDIQSHPRRWGNDPNLASREDVC